MSVEVLSAITGTSGLFGLVSLIAYFNFLLRKSHAERSVRNIIGEVYIHKADEVVVILKEFPDAATRIEALKLLLQLPKNETTLLYDRIRGGININTLAKAKYGNFSGTLGVFFLLASIGGAYEVFQSRSGPTSSPISANSGAVSASVSTSGSRLVSVEAIAIIKVPVRLTADRQVPGKKLCFSLSDAALATRNNRGDLEYMGVSKSKIRSFKIDPKSIHLDLSEGATKSGKAMLGIREWSDGCQQFVIDIYEANTRLDGDVVGRAIAAIEYDASPSN